MYEKFGRKNANNHMQPSIFPMLHIPNKVIFHLNVYSLPIAAAGGTGQFAVQLAKKKGCHVIGTCSSEEKVQFLKVFTKSNMLCSTVNVSDNP